MTAPRGDDQIQGVLLNVADVAVMPSMMEDLRAGLAVLQDSGKFIVAWSESMSQRALHFNSAADEVYLHPQGGMTLNGLRSQSMFYPGMFEKLGIDVTVVRGPGNKYKSAVEPFLRKDFSDANKEQTRALLSGFWQDMASDVEGARGLEPGTLDALANDLTIRSPQDAVDAKLVDGLLYEDELTALLEEKLDGEEPSFISLGEYTLEEQFLGGMDALAKVLEEVESEEEDGDSDNLGGNVAVIYAVGAIESGQGDNATIGSETTAEALREAREADDVKAVVLRVNSPGGSALASDVIWRETMLLKEAGKPFVVSMSDLAASGGYYISCAADRIYANPTTITGSIGVFGMIPEPGRHAGEARRHHVRRSGPSRPRRSTRRHVCAGCGDVGGHQRKRDRRLRHLHLQGGRGSWHDPSGSGRGGPRPRLDWGQTPWPRGWWTNSATWKTPWRTPQPWQTLPWKTSTASPFPRQAIRLKPSSKI